MRSSRAAGMSLVEATIILAVMSLLTAVLAPTIMAYVDDARQVRAKKDVEVIGTALARMVVDVGEVWVLRDGNGTAATDPPAHTSANRVDLLVSNGNLPAVGVARAVGTPDWNAADGNLGVQTLQAHLTMNTPSNTSANGYRTPANMGDTTNYDPPSGAGANAEFGWRGAYLPLPIGPDPWGQRYAVNVEFLAKALGAGPFGNVNDVFVLCAGPNARTDVRFDTDGVTTIGDDVMYVVAGATR